jgi:hypothetical protein
MAVCRLQTRALLSTCLLIAAAAAVRAQAGDGDSYTGGAGSQQPGGGAQGLSDEDAFTHKWAVALSFLALQTTGSNADSAVTTLDNLEELVGPGYSIA